MRIPGCRRANHSSTSSRNYRESPTSSCTGIAQCGNIPASHYRVYSNIGPFRTWVSSSSVSCRYDLDSSYVFQSLQSILSNCVPRRIEVAVLSEPTERDSDNCSVEVTCHPSQDFGTIRFLRSENFELPKSIVAKIAKSAVRGATGAEWQ